MSQCVGLFSFLNLAFLIYLVILLSLLHISILCSNKHDFPMFRLLFLLFFPYLSIFNNLRLVNQFEDGK